VIFIHFRAVVFRRIPNIAASGFRPVYDNYIPRVKGIRERFRSCNVGWLRAPDLHEEARTRPP